MNENEGFGFVRPEIIALLDGFVASYAKAEEERFLEYQLQEAWDDGYIHAEQEYRDSAYEVGACFNDDHQDFLEEKSEVYNDWIRERSKRAYASSGISVGDIGVRAKTLE